MGYYLGIDIGTTTYKGVLLNDDLCVAASCRMEHVILMPHVGWAEQDAQSDWWESVGRIIRSLTSQAGIGCKSITSVGISALFPALVAVDANGVPGRNAMLYAIDTRAKDEVGELNERYGKEALTAIAGNPLSVQSVYPKMLWYRKKRTGFVQQDQTVHERVRLYRL